MSEESVYDKILVDRQRRIEKLAGQLQPLVREGSLVLELGCGHGHFLTEYAQQFPEKRCLGIDLISKRIEKATAKSSKRRLNNVQFLKADVNEFFAALPHEVCLETVFMLYPDPWPKKRHFRRRMIQTALLQLLEAKMASGSAFYFRTDDDALYQWALEHFHQRGCWQVEEGAAWPFERVTVFEELTGRRRDFRSVYTGAACAASAEDTLAQLHNAGDNSNSEQDHQREGKQQSAG